MKHQLWATGLTFAMFRVEKGVPVDQFILWFPEDMPYEVELSLLYQLDEQILFHFLEDSITQYWSLTLVQGRRHDLGPGRLPLVRSGQPAQLFRKRNAPI